jgi:hypothetical protein
MNWAPEDMGRLDHPAGLELKNINCQRGDIKRCRTRLAYGVGLLLNNGVRPDNLLKAKIVVI